MREIKFRAWFYDDEEEDRFMDYQGSKDCETAQEFWSYNEENKTIMQYTGLKDRNGVEIYEGDIIDGHILGRCEVRYYKNSFVLWAIDGDFSINYAYNELEVIGNIYENPELLKNENKH